jgi:hypothetical protein
MTKRRGVRLNEISRHLCARRLILACRAHRHPATFAARYQCAACRAEMSEIERQVGLLACPAPLAGTMAAHAA